MTDYHSREALESWAYMLDLVANDAVNMAGTHHKWDDKALVDATLILMEVFMCKMYDKHKDKLTQKQMEELAHEAGASMRQTIKLFTGIDMHDAVNETLK